MESFDVLGPLVTAVRIFLHSLDHSSSCMRIIASIKRKTHKKDRTFGLLKNLTNTIKRAIFIGVIISVSWPGSSPQTETR